MLAGLLLCVTRRVLVAVWTVDLSSATVRHLCFVLITIYLLVMIRSSDWNLLWFLPRQPSAHAAGPPSGHFCGSGCGGTVVLLQTQTQSTEIHCSTPNTKVREGTFDTEMEFNSLGNSNLTVLLYFSLLSCLSNWRMDPCFLNSQLFHPSGMEESLCWWSSERSRKPSILVEKAGIGPHGRQLCSRQYSVFLIIVT